MKQIFFLTLIMLMLTCSLSFAQTDTIRVMTYNILNFPGNDGNQRIPHFTTILSEIQPDILVVQEMQTSAGVTNFRDDVLGEEYDSAPFINGPDTDNAMFYRANLFEFTNQEVVHTVLRDFNIYTLQYLPDPNVPPLHISSAHLKASQGGENETRRYNEVLQFMNYFEDELEDDFVLFTGDLNIYTSAEAAYQELLEDDRFHDPIDSPGNWHNSNQFAEIHTQSPRTQQFGGGATGGMDDRFDFILASNEFVDGLDWYYLEDTYTAFGNDGDHFNDAINDGFNAAVPEDVADALHDASDHIPIYMELVCYTQTQTVLEIPLRHNYFEMISFNTVPADRWAQNVFAPLENLVIVYEDNGSIFIPPDINTIGQVLMNKGFSLFTSEPDTLRIEGDPLPIETDYPLFTGRWNWMGYPYQQAYPTEDALVEIADLVGIILNDEGQFYIPSIGLNTMPVMEPGKGYYIFVEEIVNFNYPEDIAIFAMNQTQQISSVRHEIDQWFDIQPTGKPYVILFELDGDVSQFQDAVIEVLDGEQVVGRSLLQPQITPITAWQADDETGMDGYTLGHSIELRLLNPWGEEIPVSLEGDQQVQFGDAPYAFFTLAVDEQELLPRTAFVSEPYPNPFNSYTTVDVKLPERAQLEIALFNIEGRLVQTSHKGTMSAGEHRLTVHGEELSSGIYFLLVKADGQSIGQKKVVLMK